MSAPAFDIKRLLHTARTTKRFWLPLFVVVFVAVNASMVFVPKKYQSSAQVLINKPKLTTIMGQVGNVLNINDQLATIREQITSFSFMDGVARKLNLGRGMPVDSQEYQGLIDGLRRNIDLHVKGSDLFTVTFTADDNMARRVRYAQSAPTLARDITAEIVNQYIALSSAGFTKDAGNVKTFLQGELTVAERSLQTVQGKVTLYKQEHPNEIPDVQVQNVTRLQKLKGDRETADGTLAGLQSALAIMKKKLKEAPAEIVAQRTTADNNALPNLRNNRKNLEAQIQLMLKDFTEKHPKVIEMRQQLAQIDQTIAAQTNQTTQTETRAANPAIQTLNDKITETESLISQTEASLASMNTEITTLVAWQKQVPLRQAELDNLNNAVNNEREHVDTLRKRLNESQNAAAMNSQGEGPSFDLSDPPRLEASPVSPNPTKFMVLAIALACFASAALIYLLMLFDSAVRSVEEARRLLQMPVLGVVQKVITTADSLRQARRRRFRTVGFSMGALVLVGVVALGMTVLREPLLHQVANLRSLLSK